MAGEVFTLEPLDVIPLEPEYHNVITQSESVKKDYQNISTTPTRKYKVIFKPMTTANRDVLVNHFEAQYGGYHPFSWQSVPSYIGSGANMTGRWIDDSLEISMVSHMWQCTILFEKDI